MFGRGLRTGRRCESVSSGTGTRFHGNLGDPTVPQKVCRMGSRRLNKTRQTRADRCSRLSERNGLTGQQARSDKRSASQGLSEVVAHSWYRLKAGEPCQGSLRVGTGCAGGWSREWQTRGRQQHFPDRDNETDADSVPSADTLAGGLRVAES